MRIRFLLAGAAALALAACNSNKDSAADDASAAASDDAAMADASMGDASMSAGADADAMPTTAQGFVDTAAASDMYEVEAGKLARDMGTSQAVKDFGAMMVKDHTTSTADLKTAAGLSKGVTVAPKLTAKQESDLADLKAAGSGFDKLYKTQQVAAHQAALSLLQGYAANGDDAALKTFAGKVAPIVEGHLGEAQKLP